ncbi:MAG: rod-binding protein [Xanthobacteraceae bacterium]|nr:rod-binding protein [Xanthobacteraceae bacterium]QYK44076.1 MAG: rod-binding protein [Xanthobacteraceae bacterium]
MVAPVMAALTAASAIGEAVEKLSPTANRKVKDVSQQFESVFLTNMFEEMFAGVQEQDGPLGAGPAQSAWRSMLTEEYAKSVSANGGIGIADQVQRELVALQERTR